MTTALVTGAGRNIGRAVAVELARAGHDVGLLVRADRAAAEETAELVRAEGRRAAVGVCDVRDGPAVATVIAELARELGAVSVLVNNAAVRREQPFGEIDEKDWREILDVVLDGAFHCAQAVLPGMCAAGAGRIVNIAGVTGQSGAALRAHVVTAKAGLIGLTKALAAEYAPHGVTVNAVSPGLIDTVRDAVPDHHRTRTALVGRAGTIHEVAAAVRYLASPDAAYVTGQTLGVNGGLHMA